MLNRRSLRVTGTNDAAHEASVNWANAVSGGLDVVAVNPEDHGLTEGDADGANAAANDTAWATMMAAIVASAPNTGSNIRGLPDVRFGPGTFEFSSPLELTDGTIMISGSGSGHPGVTLLKFYDSTGILLQHSDTSGTATMDAVSHYGAARSTLRDLTIEGSFTDTEAEYHGIHARTSFEATNVRIYNFAGDGFHIHADTGSVGGNSNSARIIGCEAWTCRDNFWISGNNGNAVIFVGCKSNQARRWGYFSSSSLGVTFLACSTSSNGVTADNDGVALGASVVSYNSNWYGAIAGQEAGASTNAPTGTTADNTWWYYIKPNGPTTGRPAWVSGMTVRAGGACRTEGPTSYDSWISCYAEQDQGKAQVEQRSTIDGGLLAYWVFQNPASLLGTAVRSVSTNGVHTMAPEIEVSSGTITTSIGAAGGNSNGVSLSILEATYSPSAWDLMIAQAGAATLGDLMLCYNHSTAVANTVFQITGPSTPNQFGRGAAQANCAYIPRLFIGNTSTNARQLWSDTAAPASGTWGRGDFAFHRNPTAAADPWGFRCRTGGTPGTWDTLYAMIAAKPSGWGAPTGTATRTAFDTATVTLPELAERVKAVIDDLTTRGVIGA